MCCRNHKIVFIAGSLINKQGGVLDGQHADGGSGRVAEHMSETFCEFTFEAAHKTPPYSDLHGHSFLVRVVLKGPPDPVYGWSHNLYEVTPILQEVKAELDHKYLNEIAGLSVPTLENVAGWIWKRLSTKIVGLDHLIVSRGHEGQREGTIYRGSR